MDFNTTIDLIIKDLKEASEIIDDLKKYPGVPALQVELAKSKCRSAGEVISLLKDLSEPIPAIDKPIQEKQIFQTKDEKGTSEKPVKVNQLRVPSPSVEKKAETKSPVKKTAEIPIVADKFSYPSDVYDQQSGTIKTEKDLSDYLMAKPITNLSEAIGISDKFLFIGAIFDGDKDAYTHAISRLDKAESLQDAMAIIMSYTGEKSESEAVDQLLYLVKLKFPLNE